ncbi:MAG: hypothetical protein HY705_07220 [Gemmatimonadetes bacterium]|nr:hypothetical protein [Gemmatimonadota bacterium]
MVALGFLTVWVAILCLPMLSGRFLVGPESDQIWTGVPFRWFGADEWRRTGEIPLWNPYLFGGLPYVGAMHGDIFYPTAWLRLVLPVDVAMNLGFAAHLVLAGLFTYLFLRSLDVSWTGSMVGGLAYQLSGIVASLVHPGHDGKLFVSAWMPLVLLGLVIGVRRQRLEGYGILALAVGMGIVSPHIQMMQYTLIFAGLFAVYLTFWSEDRPPEMPRRVLALSLALGAVIVGFGAAMIQLWPFIEYMPFAARTAGAQGWEYATSWAMPPANMVDWLIPEFTGILGNYWGENAAKLHSEYLGAAVLGLATLGFGQRARRRLLWFAGGAAVLFVLVSLGGHTPFYRLWYALVPGVKVTRAAGMAFFVPTFLVAMAAALGVERIERGEGRRTLTIWLIGAGGLLLLGASGALGSAAESLADPSKADLARRNGGAIAFGAVRSAFFGAALAGVGLAAVRGRLHGLGLALGLGLIVGGDLVTNVRRFFTYSPPAATLYADDSVTRRLATTPRPFRVLDPDVYPTAFLMAKQIANALGHHGNEMHSYDELLGGKNVWRNVLGSQALWDLLAIRFVIVNQRQNIPGYHEVLGPATTPQGVSAWLYERDTLPAYARVVPAAAKVPAEQMVPTLMDPRLDVNRVVLLEQSAPIEVPRLDSLPAPSATRAEVVLWEPGAMTIRLTPAADADAYLLVSENWYPDWYATVDARPAPVLRGDYTFITVPIPRGAREVRLTFRSARYRTGAMMSLASLVGILVWIGLPVLVRRRRG